MICTPGRLVRTVALSVVGLLCTTLKYISFLSGVETQTDEHLPVMLPLTRRRNTDPSLHSGTRVPLQEISQVAMDSQSQPLELWSLPWQSSPPSRIVALRNIANTQYSLPIKLGTPPQDLEVLIDTGSSDLWVGPKRFHKEASSTLMQTGMQRTVNYGQGTVLGDLLLDDLMVGNQSVEGQTFLLITSESKDMHILEGDGVLGLGPAILSHSGETVLEHLQERNGISTFSLLLCDYVDGSTLVLGMPPTKWYNQSTLVYTPSVTDMWWALDGALVVGGKEVEWGPFLLDSGTSFLGAKRDNYFDLVKSILPEFSHKTCTVNNKTLRVICPCDMKSDLKTVEVRVEGTSFPISKDLFFAPIEDGTGGDDCVLEVQPIPDGSPLILGDTFLKAVVAMFDSGPDGPRIGLAKRSPDAPPGPEGFDLRRMAQLMLVVTTVWLIVEVALYIHYLYRRRQYLQMVAAQQAEIAQQAAQQAEIEQQAQQVQQENGEGSMTPYTQM